MEDTYQKLSNNQYPGGNCQQLEVFSNHLYTKLKEVTDDATAQRIYNKLIQSHKVESLMAELDSNQINNDDLRELAKASGYFIASARMMSIP
ncbi:MAG: hypothetical protein IPJ79_02605 [Bacteroidetes bacterium]|nr:hypothetical protein [Bacteroidota bacterium]